MAVGGAPPASWQSISLDLGDLRAIHEALLNARRLFLQAGDRRSAAAVARIYAELNDGLRLLALEVARSSEHHIRERIRATQKRPDTGRGRGLIDNIKSSTWDPTPSVSVGWVAIAQLKELDKTVNPYSSSQEPYWRAQEYGYRYSHIPTGFFFGPGYSGPISRPSPSQAGLHPLFVPSAKGGTFRSPPQIEARHFLRDGASQAIREWRSGFGQLQSKVLADMNRVLAARGVTR